MLNRASALTLLLPLLCVIPAMAVDKPGDPTQPLRVGIIGLDTSHCIAFTRIINDPKAGGDLAGLRVVAGFPGGSPDVPSSHDRVERFTTQLKGMNVEIVDSIPALLGKVDVVLLESVDGRPHLAQARAVFEAAKPVFIDKPLAGILADAADESKRHNGATVSIESVLTKAREEAKGKLAGN